MALGSKVSDPLRAALARDDKPIDTLSGVTPSLAAPDQSDFPAKRVDVDLRTGRIRPISVQEWRERQDQLTKRLAEIDLNDDTPDEVYDQFMRNLDDERRRQGRPTAFDGYYQA